MPLSDYKIHCFVHIPRTGGNFVLSGLYTRQKPEGPLFLFGLNHEGTADDIRPVFNHGPGTYVLHGHCAYGVDRLIPEYEISYFTFLREPVARTISDFLWPLRLAKTLDKTRIRDLFHKWIDSMECANHQTRYLAGPIQDKVCYNAHLNLFGSLDGDIATHLLKPCDASMQ